MALSRPVVAFALLSQCSELLRTDLLGGIAVLVRPLVRGLAGQRFSAEALSQRIAEAYGLAINAQAIEDFLPRFEQAGLIELRRLSDSASEAVFREVETSEDVPYEQDFQGFLQKFIDFAQERLRLVGVQLSNEILTAGLLTRLATYDFSAIKAKPDRSQRDVGSETRILGPSAKDEITLEKEVTPEARLDVLVASFLRWVTEEDPSATELASKVAEGALGAELIFDLRAPQVRADLSRVTVVLDTPLILSLLDLSGRQDHKLATNLVQQIRESKAELAVFHHSIEEAEGVLAAVKNGIRFGDAYGPTAERMRDNSYSAFFHTMIGAVQRRLKDAGFRVIPPTRDIAFQHFTKDNQDSLTNRLRFGQADNRLARERDALSVAETIRLRAGVHVEPAQIEGCRYVFVTANPVLQRQARDYLISQRTLNRTEFPPIITDRTFCGLAWLLFGGTTAESLPTAKLLANCANALRTRPDVVKKTKAFLEKIDTAKARHFEVLMTSERAGRYLTEISLGDSVLITEENAETILEKLEELAGEKVGRQKDEYYGKIIAQTEQQLEGLKRQLDDTNRSRDEVLEHLVRAQQEGELRANEADLFKVQLQRQNETTKQQLAAIGRLTGQVGDLAQAVSTNASTIASLKESAIRTSARLARRRLHLLQYVVLASFIAAAWLLGYADKFVVPAVPKDYASWAQHGLLIAQVGFGVAGFWVFSDKLFGRSIRNISIRYFAERLLELGYSDPGPEYSIDFDTFTVTKQSGPE